MTPYIPLNMAELDRIEHGTAIYAVIPRKVKGWASVVDMLLPVIKLKPPVKAS